MVLELKGITHSFETARPADTGHAGHGQAKASGAHVHGEGAHTHGAGLYALRPGNLFDNFSLELAQDERVALKGQNGSGKTTLMHIIMGLIRPSAAGSVIAFGQPCDTSQTLAAMRRRVGFLFQDSDDQLFCPTVEEDVAFGPLNLGLTHAGTRERVMETLEALGIGQLRKCITHKLSGGEKRLVAFATIAAMRPELYILDEPLTGLDSQGREIMTGYIRRHVRTALITSHDEEFLGEVTTRGITL